MKVKQDLQKNLATEVTNGDVVAKDQIRLIIKTFKDRLPKDLFPGRTEAPKTLIFAKTDLHADDIVKIVREEFGKGNKFCQKITSKSHKPDELLQSFRNSCNPRIAVVDPVRPDSNMATGELETNSLAAEWPLASGHCRYTMQAHFERN